MWTNFLQDRGGGNAPKNLLIFLDDLSETRVKVHALKFLRKILLSGEAALFFFLFLDATHSFGGQCILLVVATLLGIVKAVYQGCFRIRESHHLIILLGPYRGFPRPLEEVQAGPSLDTLSLSPQDLLKGSHIVLRDGYVVG